MASPFSSDLLPSVNASNPAGTDDESSPTLCPICLSATLSPQNQCTLRGGHAQCNLCLPQLLSPNCPICRQPIWRSVRPTSSSTSPWLIENHSVMLNPMPDLLEDELDTESDHNTENDDNEDVRIPVLLLTREQIRAMFRQ